MPLLGKVVVLDLARCEEVGDARRGKLRREHVVLTPKGGGVYFILFFFLSPPHAKIWFSWFS